MHIPHSVLNVGTLRYNMNTPDMNIVQDHQFIHHLLQISTYLYEILEQVYLFFVLLCANKSSSYISKQDTL